MLPSIIDLGVIINGTTQCTSSCFVGIELDGSACSGCAYGLQMTAGSSTIKGLVINSFTSGPGIEIVGPSSGNTVNSNFIGTNVALTTADPNATGVVITNSASNQIGASPIGNAISGNSGDGVYVHGASSASNKIQFNAIGTDFLPWTTAIPNTGHGVHIGDLGSTAHHTLVGGLVGMTSLGNIIRNNGGAGIAEEVSVLTLLGPLGNQFVANSIYANGGLGIDISPLGAVTHHFAGALTSALHCPACYGTGLTSVTGYIQGGPASTAVRVGGARSPSLGCDPSGYGEGRDGFSGTTYVPAFVTDSGGNLSASGAILSSGFLVGQYITTHVTWPDTVDGKTTEFYNCVVVESDTDSDGTHNTLDPSGSFSDDFSDGTTFGSIVSRGSGSGCYVSVVDLAFPDGVVIGTICPFGGGPTMVSLCGTTTIELVDGTSTTATCGSVHLQVDLGPLTAEFGIYSATLLTQTTAEIEDLGGGAYQVTNDPSSASALTVDGHSVAPGETVVLGPDTDGDGCPDSDEAQDAPGSQLTGGRRDYWNPWDYFNPEKVNTPYVQSVADILKVVQQFGQNQFLPSPPNPPNTPNPAYTTATDRTNIGPNSWNLGPPDGVQSVADILAAVYQYNHNCGP